MTTCSTLPLTGITSVPRAATGRATLLIRGPGAAEGRSAAYTMIANGFNSACDDDTYTVVPFVLDKAGITRDAVL